MSYVRSPIRSSSLRGGVSKYCILASSGVGVSVTGTTNETILATVTIPAGIMGLNGALRINALWDMTSSGNNKTPRIRLGGISGTIFFQSTGTTSGSYSEFGRVIQNAGSASAQISKYLGTTIGFSSQPGTTGSVNTAVAQDLVFTGQLANSGETITIKQYSVELILP